MTVEYLDAKRIQGQYGAMPDSLGSSADGTLIGDPAQDTTPTPPTGLGTSSFYFDGNDAIDIDGAEPFSTTVGSVSLWFYNDGTSESKVICCFADTDATAQLLFETKTNGIMCKVRSSSTTYWEIRRNSVSNGGALSTGWHHIVASQDGTAVKVYVDKVLLTTFDVDSDKSKWMLTEIDNGRIGCVNKNSSGNVDFFTGNCMEIGLWNVALTSTQVESLYGNGGSTAKKANTEPTGLRAYYSLSGTTVTNDAVATDDKATLIGTSAGSAKFDGDDDTLAIGSGSNALTPADFTIAFWYKPISISSPSIQRIYHNGGTGSEKLEIQIYNDNIYATVGSGSAIQSADLVNDTAEHWVITNSSGTITVYRDNVQDGTGSGGATRADTATGKAISHTSETLNGYLGDFVLTTDVITESERSDLANGYMTPSALDNKVLYYPLTANFNDSSGNGYNGTAGGDTAIDTSVGFKVINIPENSIFNETDTYKQYWLQDGEWKNSFWNKTATGDGLWCGGAVSGGYTSTNQVATDYVWGTSTALNSARGYCAGAGYKSAFIVVGGYDGSIVDNSAVWNGSSWATEVTLNTERRDTSAIAGNSSDCIVVMGRNGAGTIINTTAKWNGSTWASAGAIVTTAGEHGCGDGNTSDMMYTGGYDGSSNLSSSGLYNGTIWSTGVTADWASYGANLAGANTSAMHQAGGTYASSSVFNGTSWENKSAYDESNDTTTIYCSGGGVADSHWIMGTNNTDRATGNWNGTSWETKGDMSVQVYAGAGDGSK